MSRVIELKWTCGECGSEDILGRHKRCPNCGSPREKGEMQMRGLGSDDYDSSGRNKAESVTDPDLMGLAGAGADWFCPHCESGNRGDGDRCDACGGPRHKDPVPQTRREKKRADQRYTLDLIRTGRLAEELRLRRNAEDDYETAKRRKHIIIGGGIAAAVLFIGIFIFWATRTHLVDGDVTRLFWEHTTVIQTWTDVVVGRWENDTQYRPEVKPVNGRGERPGMEKILESCHEKHHHDEQYECGSHEECSPRYRTESYTCGEVCTDNGNGFATCQDKICTRQVEDGEDCRTVTDYCDRPIYETWCDYKTQEWRETKALTTDGEGLETSWIDIPPGPLDRIRFRANYEVTISYRDRGRSRTYVHHPSQRKGNRLMGLEEAQIATERYRKWNPYEKVVLTINNLGGIRSVEQGGIMAEAVGSPIGP